MAEEEEEEEFAECDQEEDDENGEEGEGGEEKEQADENHDNDENGQEGAKGEEKAAGPGEEDDGQNAENAQDEVAGEGDAPRMELWEDYIAPVFPTADLRLEGKVSAQKKQFCQKCQEWYISHGIDRKDAYRKAVIDWMASPQRANLINAMPESEQVRRRFRQPNYIRAQAADLQANSRANKQ